jgi:type IV secretory pathway component VirB8
MNEIKKIEIRKYPQMVQEFAKENFNLKMLSALLLTVVIIVLTMLLYLIKHGPTVIALNEAGSVAKIETTITDLQIQSAIKEYLSYRYNWDEKTIAAQLGKAQFFVAPSLVSSFQKSMLEVQKYVREKKITQRVYPKSITIDLKNKSVNILADRITEFDALKAATELRLTLQFRAEDRSVTNPWGIYITRETEGGTQ